MHECSISDASTVVLKQLSIVTKCNAKNISTYSFKHDLLLFGKRFIHFLMNLVSLLICHLEMVFAKMFCSLSV